jgi:ribonuclease BN (tRNA processing enzyme)
VQVRVLTNPTTPGHATTTIIVDDVLAVDAGSLGWFASAEVQSRIRNVVLTHSHIDHVAGLPVFVDNVYQLSSHAPVIHAIPETLQALQGHIFNDVLMPDFIALSETMPAFFTLSEVQPDVPFECDGYTLTAYPVDHTVPTVAYTIDDGTDIIAILTDSAPQPELLARWAKLPRLRTVYLEASFPRRMADLARITKHHTTQDFLMAKGMMPCEVVPIHIKPRYATEVLAELAHSSVMP